MSASHSNAFARTMASTLANVRLVLPFHAAVLVYTAIVLAISAFYGTLDALAHPQYVKRLGAVYFLVLPAITVSVPFILIPFRFRDSPGRREALGRMLAPDLLGRAFAGMLALASFVIFMGSFTTFKNLMPEIMGGFLYDQAQANIDYIIHGGRDPGQALLALAENATARRILEFNYSLVWSLAAFLPIYFIATIPEADGVRLRYFISLFSVWVVLGSILACLFLSAGPAFFGQVSGDFGRYGALLAALSQGAEVGSAISFQSYLWNNHIAGTAALATGISAFPSVHVGVAMMNALFLHEIDRRLGLVGFIYVVVIAVSSVTLAWHYAIDGYVSILVVTALYFGIRRLPTFRSAANTMSLAGRSGESIATR